jgi:hypothetical protein
MFGEGRDIKIRGLDQVRVVGYYTGILKGDFFMWRPQAMNPLT